MPSIDTEFLTPGEVAKILKVSPTAVIRQFADLPGVVDLGTKERMHKRRKRLLRIPRSVLNMYIARQS